MIIRDPLPRRTFLQSMGAVVALPMLDAMIPTRRLFREARRRLRFVPNHERRREQIRRALRRRNRAA